MSCKSLHLIISTTTKIEMLSFVNQVNCSLCGLLHSLCSVLPPLKDEVALLEWWIVWCFTLYRQYFSYITASPLKTDRIVFINSTLKNWATVMVIRIKNTSTWNTSRDAPVKCETIWKRNETNQQEIKPKQIHIRTK